jgi:hypothetical protein
MHRKADRLRERYPQEPWLWRKEWQERKIPSTSTRLAIFFWCFGLFWNAIAIPTGILALPEFQAGNKLAALAFLFPLIGLGLFGKAIYETWIVFKFGTSYFLPETLPGVIGGSLKGVVQTHRRFPQESRFQIRLRCINRRSSGDDTFENTLWQEELIDVYQQASLDSGRTTIPVQIQIPRNNRSTESDILADQILWRLEATCDTPGLNYKAQFDVPVFVTADSKETPITSKATTSFDWMSAADVQIQTTGIGKEFYFPPGRHLGAVGILSLFLLLFVGATALWWHIGIWPAAVICFLCTLLFSVIVLAMLFGHTTLTVGGGKLVKRQGIWGYTIGTREYAASDIKAIGLKVGMQAGEKLYYDLEMQPKFGTNRSLGGSIVNKREAEALASELSRLLKIV